MANRHTDQLLHSIELCISFAAYRQINNWKQIFMRIIFDYIQKFKIKIYWTNSITKLHEINAFSKNNSLFFFPYRIYCIFDYIYKQNMWIISAIFLSWSCVDLNFTGIFPLVSVFASLFLYWEVEREREMLSAFYVKKNVRILIGKAKIKGKKNTSKLSKICIAKQAECVCKYTITKTQKPK